MLRRECRVSRNRFAQLLACVKDGRSKPSGKPQHCVQGTVSTAVAATHGSEASPVGAVVKERALEHWCYIPMVHAAHAPRVGPIHPRRAGLLSGCVSVVRPPLPSSKRYTRLVPVLVPTVPHMPACKRKAGPAADRRRGTDPTGGAAEQGY